MSTYNLNKPMKWAQFLEMPHDLQQKYIDTLHERFNCNQAFMSKMFGITAPWFSTYRKDHKLTLAVNIRMSKKDISEFESWLREDDNKVVNVTQDQICVTSSSDQEVTAIAPVAPVSPPKVQNLGGTIQFVGNAAAVFEKMYHIVGDERIRATITWEYT